MEYEPWEDETPGIRVNFAGKSFSGGRSMKKH
jgi:hypothetical protein